MEDTPTFASATALTILLRQREISPVELTQHFLERIDTFDGRLNAYIAVTPERAIAAARAAEIALSEGHPSSPLCGIPVALKDLFDVAGLPTTAGSLLFRERIAETDATAVRRLFAAGAALLGKTHMVEFALGGAGVNHHYGTPVNPWDPDIHRLPGGSSSGSAVAVAAGLAPLALGSDTGAVDFRRQQVALTELRRRTIRALESVDFLITPTTPFAAPTLEETEENYFPINGLCLRNTAAINLLGLCAISLPCGLTREGLPIGLQLIGRPFDELRLLRLARAYEQAAGWVEIHPDMEGFS